MNSNPTPINTTRWLCWTAAVFTTLLHALAQQEMTFTIPNELSVPEDAVAQIPFAVTGLRAGQALQVTAEVPAQNPVVDPAGIRVAVDTDHGVVTLTPRADKAGAVVVTLRATAGSLFQATRTCNVTWTAVDDTPHLLPVSNQVTTEGAPPLWVPIRMTDPDGGAVGVLTASAPPRSTFFQSLTIFPAGTNRWLKVIPRAGATGTSRVTVARRGSADTTPSAEVSFLVTVQARELVLSNTPAITGRVAQAVDINADGLLDLATVQVGGSSTYVTNINGGFFGTSIRPLPVNGTAMAWGDADGDGYLDLYQCHPIADQYSHNGYVASSAPQIPLVPQSLLGWPIRSGSAVWADLDGDGDLDLVLGKARGSSANPSVDIAKNDGRGRFSVAPTNLRALPAPARVGDFDNDGAPDLLLADYERAMQKLVVWHNDGNFQFSATREEVPITTLIDAGAVDFDGDGWLDLWVLQTSAIDATQKSLQTLALWRHTSIGFAQELVIPVETMRDGGPPAWGDFDGDGFLDFIAPAAARSLVGQVVGTFDTNHFAIYHNDGRGHFVEGNFLSPFVPRATPSAGDFNRDGRTDAWLPASDASTNLGFNRAAPVNLPPDSPNGLFAIASGNEVLFTWQPAFDPDQTAALTYNLRVGTKPGANDVIPSMSLPDGSRLIQGAGNAGFVTTHRMRLPAIDSDRIYWSVQAVDNSSAGSLWATEQELLVSTLPGTPPVLSGLQDLTLQEDSAGSMKFSVSDDLTNPADIVVTISTDNPNLFPGNLTVRSLDNHSTNRTVLLVPAPEANGTAHLVVKATDKRGLSHSETITVTVLPVNDLPILRAPDIQAFLLNNEPHRIEVEVADVETSADQLEVTAQAGNLQLTVESAVSKRYILVPSPGLARTMSVIVRVRDADNGTVDHPVLVQFAEQVFTPLANVPGAFGRGLCVDADSDGYPDLLFTNPDDHLQLAYNDHGQLRTPQPVELKVPGFEPEPGGPGLRHYLMDAGDADGDGDLDLLVAVSLPYPQGSSLLVGWNNGSGGFAWAELGKLGAVDGARFVDVDRDGDLDVIGVGQNIDSVLYINRHGNFDPSPILDFGVPSSLGVGMIVGDLDGDGLEDVLASNRSLAAPWSKSFLKNLGNSRFEPFPAPPWLAHHFLAGIAELNGDQIPDALVITVPTNAQEPPYASVWKGEGSGAFTESLGHLRDANAVTLADFTSDGRTDILMSSDIESPSEASLYRAKVDPDIAPLFAREQTALDSYQMLAVVAADVDGDGDLDLFAPSSNLSEQTIHLFRNDSIRTNHPPTAPAALKATRDEGGLVVFAWEPATDREQQSGLSYNLRVGSFPGGSDILSAAALPDGRRLLARPGNAGWKFQHRLAALKTGTTYYWSVQAVDAAFVGGPFATEQAFVVPVRTPRVEVVRGNGFTLKAVGEPGARVGLEHSQDLQSWEPLSDHTLDATGAQVLSLHAVAAAGGKFFRLRMLE